MKPSEDVIRAAFVAALHYTKSKELSSKILAGGKIQSRDTWAGDTFAGVYTNVLRFPPEQYEQWVKFFFEE